MGSQMKKAKKVAKKVEVQPETAPRFRLPDGTRSVRSPWVWRGFLFMSIIALGLVIDFASNGKTAYAAAWAVITAGWFGISMWLWRQHVKDDNALWKASSRP